MAEEYIKREDAINAIKSWASNHVIINLIEKIPAEDVAPVRHGKWEIETIREYELSYGTTAYEPIYKCSVCGISTESYLRLDEPIMPEDADFPRFCPHCGARMDGE